MLIVLINILLILSIIITLGTLLILGFFPALSKRIKAVLKILTILFSVIILGLLSCYPVKGNVQLVPSSNGYGGIVGFCIGIVLTGLFVILLTPALDKLEKKRIKYNKYLEKKHKENR